MLRILVVEPHADTAISSALLLNCWGHEVRSVAGATEALEAAVSFVPELVLMEIVLPGMDAYDLGRRLRQLPGLDHVRLAAITCHGETSYRQRSSAEGFVGHFLKPVDPELLFDFLITLHDHDPHSWDNEPAAEKGLFCVAGGRNRLLPWFRLLPLPWGI
jgi:two-component system CheB/CheR fusion protein